MLVSVIVAAAGILAARHIYESRAGLAESLAARWRGLHRLLLNKYYVDEIYDATVVRATASGARGLWMFDARVVDGIVNAWGWLTQIAAWISHMFDKYVVDGLVNLLGWSAGEGSYSLPPRADRPGAELRAHDARGCVRVAHGVSAALRAGSYDLFPEPPALGDSLHAPGWRVDAAVRQSREGERDSMDCQRDRGAGVPRVGAAVVPLRPAGLHLAVRRENALDPVDWRRTTSSAWMASAFS